MSQSHMTLHSQQSAHHQYRSTAAAAAVSSSKHLQAASVTESLFRGTAIALGAQKHSPPVQHTHHACQHVIKSEQCCVTHRTKTNNRQSFTHAAVQFRVVQQVTRLLSAQHTHLYTHTTITLEIKSYTAGSVSWPRSYMLAQDPLSTHHALILMCTICRKHMQ